MATPINTKLAKTFLIFPSTKCHAVDFNNNAVICLLLRPNNLFIKIFTFTITMLIVRHATMSYIFKLNCMKMKIKSKLGNDQRAVK